MVKTYRELSTDPPNFVKIGLGTLRNIIHIAAANRLTYGFSERKILSMICYVIFEPSTFFGPATIFKFGNKYLLIVLKFLCPE